MDHDRRPRPYSTLRDGKIVWVTPEEHAQSWKVKRTHLETDQEVRARLRKARTWDYWYPMPNFGLLNGRELDDKLKSYGLPPRQYVEDEG